MNSLVKFATILGLFVVFSGIFVACSTTRVDVGHVGVKVKLAGTGRGVQDMQIKTGWVIFNPLTEQVVEFPVSVQNIILSSDPHEGGSKDDTIADHVADESITFSSIEGVNATANVGFSFHIDPSKAPQLYSRFRQTNMRELAYSYMRNVIREAFSDVGSKMPIQDIYGAGKTKLVADVARKCQDILGKDGVVVDQLTINGALKLPENVAAAINNAMAATQNAIQSENKVRQIKAEADQAIAAAHGAAEAARQQAQGQADALLISAKAEATARGMSAEAEKNANNLLQVSLTPQILHFRGLQKWDGKLPVYNAGNAPTPMIDVAH